MTNTPDATDAARDGTDSHGVAARAAEVVTMTLADRRLWLLVLLVFVVAAGAQLIGPIAIPLGIASVTLLPMIWGLLAGGLISGQPWRRFPLDLQQAATAIMSVAVLFLCARLSLTIGPNIPLLLEVGPALLLQEVGNLGTILFALPLAVLLRMGPATVGATFSIDRESAFAMVGERYGTGSDQYRGVLSMYVFGTVFGALLVSLIASLATALKIFDPLALAMGSGVGSGSMMAAAAAAVVSEHPDSEQQVLALAATSNMITSALGLYVGVWVALPLADRFYRLLTRRRRLAAQAESGPGAVPEAGRRGTSAAETVAKNVLASSPVRVPVAVSIAVFCVGGLLTAVIASRSFSVDMLLTYAVMTVLVLLGMGFNRLVRRKVPVIIFVTTLGVLATSPLSPIADWLVSTAESVDFLAMITVMLTLTGFSLGKDLPLLKQIGWKIIPVGTVALMASFLASTTIAHFVLSF
jgi:hypothetical protein